MAASEACVQVRCGSFVGLGTVPMQDSDLAIREPAKPARGAVAVRVAAKEPVGGWAVQVGAFKQKTDANDLVTNELIDEINKFEVAEIQKLAREWTGK